jgi:glycosyltransferase involved in cell wall biosynthesis
MNAAVSVLIPCYNQARYLPAAVHSVQAQSMADWEVIIINDGSTDNTDMVAKQLTDSRIHYVLQSNQGLAAARNTGIGLARGEYLVFLDSDDELEPQFLQIGLEILNADQSLAGIYCRNYHIDEQENVLPEIGGHVIARADFRRRMLEGGFFPPHAVIIRAAIAHEVGLFDTNLSGEADWDFWLRVSERHQMEGVNKPLVRYRVHSASMSTDLAHMRADCFAVLGKHFGSSTASSTTWSEEKRRAYGFAYRYFALGHIQRGQFDEAWHLMVRAVAILPDLLNRLDTFYELACADQPRVPISRVVIAARPA